jgi:glutaredoxin-related protein
MRLLSIKYKLVNSPARRRMERLRTNFEGVEILESLIRVKIG